MRRLRGSPAGEPAAPERVRPRVWAAAGACLLLALAATGLLLVDPRDPPRLLLFVGRFHPMVVHFPIGLILLAALLDGFAAVYRPLRVLRHATGFVLFLGAVSAAVSVLAGWLLSLEGGYDEAALGAHRWLGIAVALGAAAATALKLRARWRPSRALGRAYGVVLAASVAALLLAGHLGAALTHGSGYLTHYLPPGLRGVVGLAEASAARPRIADVDSAYLYRDLVAPVLEARCASCHNDAKEKGGLRLDTPEGVMKGGDDGPVVVAGSPDESELLRRITLPPSDEDAMPPEGAAPLDVGETELIRWWIAHGASLEHRVADLGTVPTAVATLLRRVAPPRPEPKRGVYALEARPADPAAVEALRRAGYRVREVAGDVPLLHVAAPPAAGDAEVRALLPVAGQITWLDLGGTRVTDAGLEALARMPNLTRLFLEETAVGDAGLRHLGGLRHLQYLNLYGTRVTDEGARALAGLESLQAVYLWRTGVTEAGAERLRGAREGLRVDRGAAPRAAEAAAPPS